MHCSIVSGKSMPWQTPNKGQRRIFITSSLPFPNAWLKPGCRGPKAPSPCVFLSSFLSSLSSASMHWFRNSFWKLCLPNSLLKSGIEMLVYYGASAPRLYKQAQCTVLSPLSHCMTVMYRAVSPPPHKYKSVFSAKLRRIWLHNEACPFSEWAARENNEEKAHKVNEQEWEIFHFFFNHQRVSKIAPFFPLISWIFCHLALGWICRIVLGADKMAGMCGNLEAHINLQSWPKKGINRKEEKSNWYLANGHSS